MKITHWISTGETVIRLDKDETLAVISGQTGSLSAYVKECVVNTLAEAENPFEPMPNAETHQGYKFRLLDRAGRYNYLRTAEEVREALADADYYEADSLEVMRSIDDGLKDSYWAKAIPAR